MPTTRSAVMAAPTATSTSTAAPPLQLSDPILSPFLASDFTVSGYLNQALPDLAAPTTTPSPPRRAPNAEPLSVVSSSATTLLSTLDLQTNRLMATLQTLTDEIVRVGPRLGYEVDLLRSDVVAFGEALETGPGSDEAVAEKRPADLERLDRLARVRERLEEVVRIFGDAMNWSLDDAAAAAEKTAAATTSTSTSTSTSTAAATAAMDMAALGKALPDKANPKKGSGPNPTEEIVYLVAAGELDAAAAKVEDLRKLAKVFEGTVEGPARAAVVETLSEHVAMAIEKQKRKSEPDVVKAAAAGKTKTDAKKGEEEASAGQGWGSGYGLINQLSRMRGIS